MVNSVIARSTTGDIIDLAQIAALVVDLQKGYKIVAPVFYQFSKKLF